MNQSQRSLSDQIEDLRAIAQDAEYNINAPISDLHARKLVELANRFGLYDAADFIDDQIGSNNVSLGEPK